MFKTSKVFLKQISVWLVPLTAKCPEHEAGYEICAGSGEQGADFYVPSQTPARVIRWSVAVVTPLVSPGTCRDSQLTPLQSIISLRTHPTRVKTLPSKTRGYNST